jgi:hypothetical protein
VFAGGLTLTDPVHQAELDRLRRERYAGRKPAGEDVEVRDLRVYDRVAA